jgi:glycosyltransferase involved in cell wall biosynthesis
VLVVEELAHRPDGHFPVRCAQLAAAYAELGYEVELLTSEGWAGSATSSASPFGVSRYRTWARATLRRVEHWRGRKGALAHVVRTLILVTESEARARRMTPEPDAVIVLACRTDPVLVAILASRRRWLLHQFWERTAMRQFSKPPLRDVLRSLATRREARRRVAHGRVIVAAPVEERRAEWVGIAPYLDPIVMPIAGARELAPAPDARARLHLPTRTRLALVFGARIDKSMEAVTDAFDTLDDWILVVGGTAADEVGAGARRRRFPGIVSDEVRDLLFLAADLVILPYPPNYRNDSGTLMDAVSAGVPVVCPDDAAAAGFVRAHGLGTTYASGDSQALAQAVRRAPARLDPEALAAVRREHSSRAVARRQLFALGIVPLSTCAS